MSDNVEITMSAKDDAVIKSLQSVDRAFSKLADRMGEVEKKGVHAGKHTEEAFGGLTHKLEEAGKEVAGLITGMVTLEKIAEAFLKTLEDIKKRREKAANAQTEYAVEAKKFAAAAVGVMNGAESDHFIKQTAKQAHADPTKTASALHQAFIAANVHDKKGALEIQKVVGEVLALHKDESAEDVGAIAAAAARFQATVGKGARPGAGLGLLEKIKRESGLMSNEAMSRQLVPAIMEGDRAGMTPAQSGALFATIAHAVGDPTGRLSKTAFTHLVEELGKHFPGQNPAELVARMQGGDKKLLKTFQNKQWVKGIGEVPGATFDDKSRAAVMSVLTGHDGTGKATDDVARFRRLGSELTDANAGQKVVDDTKRNFAQIPAVRLLERKETGEAAAKGVRVDDEFGGKAATIGEQIENNMAAAGFWWGRRWATGQEFERRVGLGEDPSKVGQQIFKSLAHELEHPPMFKHIPFLGNRRAYAPDPKNAAVFRDLAAQNAELDEEDTPAEEPADAPPADKPLKYRRADYNRSVIEGVDAAGNVLQSKKVGGGDGQVVQQLVELNRGMRSLIEQGNKPTQVVDVSHRRTEVATTSVAAAAFSH